MSNANNKNAKSLSEVPPTTCKTQLTEQRGYTQV
jgi:hypothetical protein